MHRTADHRQGYARVLSVMTANSVGVVGSLRYVFLPCDDHVVTLSVSHSAHMVIMPLSHKMAYVRADCVASGG